MGSVSPIHWLSVLVVVVATWIAPAVVPWVLLGKTKASPWWMLPGSIFPANMLVVIALASMLIKKKY